MEGFEGGLSILNEAPKRDEFFIPGKSYIFLVSCSAKNFCLGWFHLTRDPLLRLFPGYFSLDAPKLARVFKKSGPAKIEVASSLLKYYFISLRN